MRLRSSFLLLLPGLLAACEPALSPGPRVDFVGSARFNATTRRITTPGDTVAVKVYAEAQDSTDAPLKRLVITTTYRPALRPIVYDAFYRESETTPLTLTYLDTVLTAAGGFAFQSVLGARTTAGREEWRYTATDTKDRSGTSSFFLRLGRADSAAVVHSYTVSLQAPGAFGRRSFLALREGLALPKFSVRTLAANQALIDVVYGAPVAGAPTLATPTHPALKLNWATPRRTELRRTSLTAANFSETATTEAFATAFNGGQTLTPATTTGPLLEGQVLAFRTPENIYGLLLVQDITPTGIQTMILQVRVLR